MTGISEPQNQTIPTPKVLYERARALLPKIRERVPQAHKECRIPDETIQELEQAGLFKVLHPARYGGYEMDPRVFFKLETIIAEACTSTAWVYGIIAVHNYQMGLFDDKAQQEVWKDSTDVRISSSYQPVGKVVPVDGGFRLSGRWAFSSGCEHCTWAFLGSIVPPAQKPDEGEKPPPPDMRTFLVPRADYRIEHTWDTLGLRGTGSHDVIVKDAFVPEHRTHKALDAMVCQNPGQKVNHGDLFKFPWAQVFMRSLSTVCVGAALGAIKAYRDIASQQVSTNTGKSLADDPFAQNVVVVAEDTLDKILLALERDYQEMHDMIRKNEDIPLTTRLRYRYNSAAAAEQSANVVNRLLRELGGRGIYMKNPLASYFLDTHTARAHIANTPSKVVVPLGYYYMSDKLTEFFL